MMTSQIVLATLLMAAGQDEPKPATRTHLALAIEAESDTARKSANEQIEVMRALLIRKLGRSVGAVPTNQPLTTFGDILHVPVVNQGAPVDYGLPLYRNVATAIEPAVEGTYLDGYGVVFTVTLPATSRDPRSTGGGKPEPPLTDWELEQRRLLGQPVPEKAAAPKQTSVSDILVKLLAENGKHFTALKDDERVTIAVTFRGWAHVPQPTATTAQNSTPVDETRYATRTPREDRVGTLETLGSMHLKQGEPERAIEAFTRAVETAEHEVKQTPAGGNERLREALMKLSQALLAAGKVDEARAAMDRATAGRPASPRAANPAPPHTAAMRPARLNISAPKKLLELVGNGQMTTDEFRKKVTVEYSPLSTTKE